MAVDVAKMRERKAKRKKKSGGSSFFKIAADSEKVVYVVPPHENMESLPWVERLIHKRELPEGVKADYSIPCQRKDREDDFGKCPACQKSSKFRKKKKVDNDEYDKLAATWSAKQSPLGQVIDFSSLFDDNLKLKKKHKVKKCFLEHGKHDKCGSCYLEDSCQQGIQRYYMQVGVRDELEDHFDDEGDITNPEDATCVRIRRKGAGRFNTKYKTKLVKDTISIPEEVQKRIIDGMEDLTEIEPAPSGKGKKLAKIYDDFYALEDVDEDVDPDDMPDDDDDDDGDDTSSVDFDDDDDEDDDEDFENMRKKLKQKAKKGKMDKKPKKKKSKKSK